MNTKTKFAAALTALTLAAAVALPSSEAQAKPKWGVAAGLIGAGIVAGSIYAAHAHPYPVYADGYRCRRVAQFDAWGNFIGSTKVCRYYY